MRFPAKERSKLDKNTKPISVRMTGKALCMILQGFSV